MSAQTTLQTGVKKKLDDPTPGEKVRLLVDYSGVDEETMGSRVRDLGGHVNKHLIRDTLSITIEEDQIEDLCSLDEVVYAEIEEVWEQMEQVDGGENANFR